MKIAVAFLAVDVIDIVRAPYSRAIKVAQDDPGKPAEQNSSITRIFFQTVQNDCAQTPTSIS
jgi:hypothetical protein